MKKSRSLLAALICLFGAILFAGCDKFEEDVQPPGMSRLKVHDDHFVTEKNQGLYLNVLANDTIGSQATVRFLQPQHGTLRPDSVPGLLYYMPEQNFTGTDTFTYQACMNNTCATAMVSIRVKPDSVVTPPCVPAANHDAASVTENRTLVVNILQNDTVCTAVPVLTQLPQFGQAYLNSGNQLVYTPAPGYKGPDQVQYTLYGNNSSSPAYVNITVRPDSTLPPPCTLAARNDSASVIHNIQYTDTVSVRVLKNDSYCPGGSIPVPQLTYQPAYGWITAIGSGTNFRFIYHTNAPLRNITDRFRYRICQIRNGQQVCSTAEVVIQIK